MDNDYIVIEVPHQRSIDATTFDDENDATNHFWNLHAGSSEYVSFLENDDRYDEEGHGPGGESDCGLWEFVGHDLHALHRWTLAEAREQLAWLDTPNGGQQKIHQHLAVSAALRRFVEGSDDDGGGE